MKAAIYLRVSTEEQDEQNQLTACERFVQARGWQIVRVYKDRLSGYHENIERPDYEACKEAARRGEFQHIIVWAIDRWTRRGAYAFIQDLNDLNRCGVQLHSVQEGFLDQLNVEGELGRILRDFVAQIVALQARMESAKLSERVKAAYQRKLKEGDLAGWGRRPIALDPQAVEAKYGELRSLRKVAQHFGVSHETIRDVLSRKGVAGTAGESRISSSPARAAGTV
jgi:DNA invertase Pin-like site-specific DNA recombinase